VTEAYFSSKALCLHTPNAAQAFDSDTGFICPAKVEFSIEFPQGKSAGGLDNSTKNPLSKPDTTTRCGNSPENVNWKILREFHCGKVAATSDNVATPDDKYFPGTSSSVVVAGQESVNRKESVYGWWVVRRHLMRDRLGFLIILEKLTITVSCNATSTAMKHISA
jgi:hypothetical protein